MVSYRNSNWFWGTLLNLNFMFYSHKLDQELARDHKKPTHMLMKHFLEVKVLAKLEARVLDQMPPSLVLTSWEPSEQKLKRTIKTTPSLSARLTSTESRAPPLLKPKNNYPRRKASSKNKNKLLWPNLRQESKRCFKWMPNE